MEEFEQEFLTSLPTSFDTCETLIEHIAPLHAELLYIHPFREGNGRTARLFVDLVALKSGWDRFAFSKITRQKMPQYIAAVQAAADQNYAPMIQLFQELKD